MERNVFKRNVFENMSINKCTKVLGKYSSASKFCAFEFHTNIFSYFKCVFKTDW